MCAGRYSRLCSQDRRPSCRLACLFGHCVAPLMLGAWQGACCSLPPRLTGRGVKHVTSRLGVAEHPTPQRPSPQYIPQHHSTHHNTKTQHLAHSHDTHATQQQKWPTCCRCCSCPSATCWQAPCRPLRSSRPSSARLAGGLLLRSECLCRPRRARGPPTAATD